MDDVVFQSANIDDVKCQNGTLNNTLKVKIDELTIFYLRYLMKGAL